MGKKEEPAEIIIILGKDYHALDDFRSFKNKFAIPLVDKDGWRTAHDFYSEVLGLGILFRVHKTQVPGKSLPVWVDDKFMLVFFVDFLMEGCAVKESNVYDVKLPEDPESCDKIRFCIPKKGIENGSNWLIINILAYRGEDGETMIETTKKFEFEVSWHKE